MAIDHVSSVTLFIVVLLLGIKEITSFLYEQFGWPGWLVRHFDRRREHEIERVLRHLGFGEDERLRQQHRQLREKLERARRYSGTEVERRAEALVSNALKQGSFSVGVGNVMTFPYFVDVMSASLDPMFVDECAAVLASYLWRQGSDVRGSFTKVLGLKDGSPLLAWSLARRLNMPCALFRGRQEYRYNPSLADPVNLFDGAIDRGDRLLLVDDSTTGGRKVLDCLEAVRAIGAEVPVCLVLFLPVGKNPTALLRDQGVQLHTLIEMTEPEVQRLRSRTHRP
jgi:orotate phosphoribosyltransferase